MVLINVQPDKQWFITEERLRFAVDASVPPAWIPLTIAKDLYKAIKILEDHRGWRHITVTPSRQQFAGKPCCPKMSVPGTPLGVVFMPAAYQGDADDATNFSEVSDGSHRLLVEGLIDWVAIVHFWTPALFFNTAQLKEETPREREGFVSPELLPKGYLEAKEKRKQWQRNRKSRSKLLAPSSGDQPLTA